MCAYVTSPIFLAVIFGRRHLCTIQHPIYTTNHADCREPISEAQAGRGVLFGMLSQETKGLINPIQSFSTVS